MTEAIISLLLLTFAKLLVFLVSDYIQGVQKVPERLNNSSGKHFH